MVDRRTLAQAWIGDACRWIDQKHFPLVSCRAKVQVFLFEWIVHLVILLRVAVLPSLIRLLVLILNVLYFHRACCFDEVILLEVVKWNCVFWPLQLLDQKLLPFKCLTESVVLELKEVTFFMDERQLVLKLLQHLRLMIIFVFDPVSLSDRGVLVGVVLSGEEGGWVSLRSLHYLAVLLFNHSFGLI